jgi:site-specific DNA recombinase
LKHPDTITPALYARVSSDQQTKDDTIASQLDALRQRIAADGLSLQEELCFVDEGHSGTTLLRPALERLRDQAAAGVIDRLYVLCPDRLARKYAYQVLLIDELKRAGVALVFLNHDIDRSPEGDLLLQVQGVVAEYERAKLLERSRRGKLHAARRGSVNVLGGAPYGYRYVSQRDNNGQACYQVVEEEAAVVRQIFRWVAEERCSIGAVCRRLKQQGIASPKGNPLWNRTSVWSLLKNPAYQGAAAFGKTRVIEQLPHPRPRCGRGKSSRRCHSTAQTNAAEQVGIVVPALVEAALFAAVAEQLQENKQRQRQLTRGASYLLQGLLVCKHCGHAFYGKPIKRALAQGRTSYAYYRCSGCDGYRYGGAPICRMRQVRTDQLDAAVWEDVQGLLAHPERLQQEYERRQGSKQGAGKQADEKLAGRLHKAKQVVARLIDAYESGLLQRSEFEPRLQRARQQVAQWEAEAATVAQQQAEEDELQAVMDHLQEFANRMSARLQDTSWAARREIIRTLVKRVEVDTEGVHIIYKVNTRPFVDGPERGHFQDRSRREDCASRLNG